MHRPNKCYFIYYFLYIALFLVSYAVTQERTSREGYFQGSASYALLPIGLSFSDPITFSFRTCSYGELLSQEGQSGDYIKLELSILGYLSLKWKVRGIEETSLYLSSNLRNNIWHNVDVRLVSNSVLLKVDNFSPLVVSNSTVTNNLLSASLSDDFPNLYIGKNFTGCILEGSSVILSDARVVSSSVTWNSCPLPSLRSCDGYETDACFSQPCRGTSLCVTTPSGYKCHCTARFSGERCEIDEGPMCSRSEYNLCQNNGECVEDSLGNSTYCMCKPNFAGYLCEIPSNNSVCEQNSCNGGSCVAENETSFKCLCLPGFAGTDCSLNIDECESNPCLNNGTCIDENGSYFCHCRETGYKGQNCEENINECLQQNPCSSGSTCFDNYGSYVCICPPGKGGKDCEIHLDGCSSQPCQNGGTCIARGSSFECRCPLGFEGNNCETNFDDCAIAMCPSNSHCVDGVNRYVCECDEGFVGNPPNCSPNLNRIIESTSPLCHASSCFNGGTCLTEPGKNYTTCICAAGFTGHLCETRCDILCVESGSCSACNVAEACASNPCQNKKACRSLINHSYICDCLPGWSGRNCEIANVRVSRLEDCESQPCLHGVCSNHRCICDVGFTGERCESVISSCQSFPCLNGGSCQSDNSSTHYTCYCVNGYSGENCEENNDDCVGVTCPDHEVCHDLVNNHECRCPAGFTGSDCSTNINECLSLPCFQGTCLDGIGNYTCLCPPGRTGRHCELNMDLCGSSPCINGICHNSNGSYRCYCEPGFTGDRCHMDINECLSNPCTNHGRCENRVNDYACVCELGYEGKNCEIDIDECLSSPCLNGATCKDGINLFTCSCVPGFTGRMCETNIDDCEAQPCINDATCLDEINGFQCVCGNSGYQGDFCHINIDDCSPYPCLNGGSCEDGIKEYECHCFEGYHGVNCEIDINECLSNPCQNDALCFEKSNSSLYEVNYMGKFLSFSHQHASGYFCECLLGFKGDNCQINIDDCEYHDCVNGTCIDGINQYHCNCIPGFEGKDCSIDINECEKYYPCEHNATCNDLVADYSCDCLFGFGGKNCETELLGCRNDPCKNQGQCVPYLDIYQQHKFKCNCPVGFSGETCELVTIVSFKNETWMEVDHSFRGSSSYDLSFQFRTTLSEGILIHSADSVDNFFFVLYLQSGCINLAINNYGILKNIKEDERAPARNDGQWKEVSVSITSNRAILNVSNWIQNEAINSDTIHELRKTFFAGGRLPTAFANYQTFIGCMREIHFNEELIIPSQQTLVGAVLGCNREEQCLPATCSKIGLCQDFWFSYSCVCPRPYYGLTCQNEVTPATFGYNNAESWAKVIIPLSAKFQLSQSTNISFFLRTRQEDGFIFYLGPDLNGISPDQYVGGSQPTSNNAFVAAFLENGYLKAVTGSYTGTIEIIMMEKMLNDGNYHVVKIFRNTTLLSISINETSNHESIPGNPLKADVIFMGGMPKSTGDITRSKRQTNLEATNNAAIYNTHSWENVTNFIGIIQDFRVNNQLVELYPLKESTYSSGENAPQTFPSLVQKNNVSEGVLSNNPCPLNPCQNGGGCRDTWNYYSCDCLPGYRGMNCDEKEPCSLHQCPDQSTCKNLRVGYECIAEAAFKGDVELKYNSNFTKNVSSNSISLKFRSQKPGGTLLHAASNGFNHLTLSVNDSVIVQWNFGLSENIGHLQVGSNVTDGNWHNIEIFINETILTAVVDGTEGYAEYTSVISLMDVVSEGEFYVGGNGKPNGFFMGCMDNARIGEVLLPFFGRNELLGDKSPNHFDLISGSETLHIGCVVCWDDFCKNGGACVNNISDFDCTCPKQYSGKYCQEDTDECLQMPCVHGDCENRFGSFLCNCHSHYTGDLCENEINYCENSPCLNGATCASSFGNFTCRCTHEYTGDRCGKLKIEKCENSPCQNDGTCSTVSTVNYKAFKCSCNDRYTGERCESEIDFCSLDGQSCFNNASCVNTPTDSTKKYQCNCTVGFYGERCEIEFDPCNPNPCINGRCVKDGPVSNKCDCNKGYEGTHCGSDIDECLTADLCKNDAFCTNSDGSYTCNCSIEFAPPHCIVPNPCIEFQCLNGGNCVTETNEDANISKPSCVCVSGFNGTQCEEKLIAGGPDTLALAVGLSLAVICAICIIVAVVIFLRIAKKKRATRGTYSPSRQEMFGSRVEMNHVMKPPPEERLI